ncbi:MAG: diguanylate cyclase domain-containing protein [Aestuariivirga sp.]
MKKVFRSIGTKIQMLTAGAFLLGLATVLSFQTHSRIQAAWQERLDANLRIVHGLAAPARGAIERKDVSAINNYMELLTSDPRAAAILLTANGKVMASQQSISFFDLDVSKLADLAIETEKAKTTAILHIGNFEFIAVPIKDGAFRNIGSIAVAWSTAGLLDNVWREVAIEILALIGVAAAVLAVLMLGLKSLVLGPLKAIAHLVERGRAESDAAAEAGAGAFARRNDEIGTFARALGIFYKNAAEKDRLHHQLDNALTHMSQGLCLSGENQKVAVANDRLCEIYGIAPGSVGVGDDADDVFRRLLALNIIAEQDRKRFEREQICGKRDMHAGTFPYELADGRSVTISRSETSSGGWVTTHTDVTALRKVEKQLLHLANHDHLTNLPNRRRFNELLSMALNQQKAGTQHAVFFIDLDGFKTVNDTRGHDVGDELLKQVAARLHNCAGNRGVVTRLGGDEFAVIVEDCTLEDAARLAEEIVAVFAAPFHLRSAQARTGASIGIAMSPQDGTTAADILKAADIAVYRAKAGGKNTYRFHSAFSHAA